jgi:hypothetical protein
LAAKLLKDEQEYDMEMERLAMICHEANRAYCISIGDDSQPRWEDAPQWQKDSAIAGVRYRNENPGATGADMHQSWLNVKMKDGWRRGDVKDAEKKEHPCMVPYSDLPYEQKVKDHLFQAVLDAVNGTWDDNG